MAKGDNSPGVSKFAGIVQQLAQQTFEAPPILDFGLIQDDGSLLTNTYPVSIPATDYLVCRCAALPNSEVIYSYETAATNKTHKHAFEDGAVLEGVTDVQSSPGAHSHEVLVPLGEIETKAGRSAQNPHGHDVDIARPSQRHLQPGDRVLVAWVFNDAVVVDIIYTADQIMG